MLGTPVSQVRPLSHMLLPHGTAWLYTQTDFFLGAKGACLMRHRQPCVEEHPETLDLLYQATAMRTTHEYTVRPLKEWPCQVRRAIQLLWECERDIFTFWATRLTLPRGTKHASRQESPNFREKSTLLRLMLCMAYPAECILFISPGNASQDT